VEQVKPGMIYETPSVRWAPWVVIVFGALVIAQAILRANGGPITPIAWAFFAAGAVFSIGLARQVSKVAWRLTLDGPVLVATYVWGRAAQIPTIQIRSVPLTGSKDRAITTTSGVRIRVYVPKGKRQSFEQFGHLLSASGRQSPEGTAGTA
jgi:hypothetical protein